MVTLKRITQAEDEAFRKLTALYTEAFPVEERREIGQLGELLHTEPAMYYLSLIHISEPTRRS